jgi:hypothetical protein
MVIWRFKRQPVVAHLSSESELVGLYSAAREGVWIASLLKQLSRPLDGRLTISEDTKE